MKLPTYRSTLSPVTHLKLYEVLRLVIPFLDAASLVRLLRVSKISCFLARQALWQDPIRAITASTHKQIESIEQRYLDWWYSDRLIRRFPGHDFGSKFQHVKILDFRDFSWEDVSEPIRSLESIDEEKGSKTFVNLKILVLPHLQNDSNMMGYSKTSILPLQLYILSTPGRYNVNFFSRVLEHSHNSLLYLGLADNRSGAADLLVALPASGLPNLAILNLQQFQLNAKRLDQILTKVNARPFSINISDNNLDDHALQVLEPYLAPNLAPFRRRDPSWLDYQAAAPAYTKTTDWQSNGERIRHENFEDSNFVEAVEYRDDSMQGIIRLLIRQGCLDANQHRSLEEDLDDAYQNEHGIDPQSIHNTVLSARTRVTNLHLGGNRFTDQQLCTTLCGRGLQHLDLGAGHPILATSMSRGISVESLASQPAINAGGILLLNQLNHSQFNRLHYLSIHHFFATGIPSLPRTDPRCTRQTHRQWVRRTETWAESQDPPVVHMPFDPDSLPSLHTLVLQLVPRQTFGRVVERIKHVLERAKEQEDLVELASRGTTARYGPKVYKGLRILRLEMAPLESEAGGESDAAGDAAQSSDVQGFYDAVDSDFSFFGGDRRESEAVPSAQVDEKIAVDELDASHVLLDVCEEIRKYRNSTAKHWSGTINVRM